MTVFIFEGNLDRHVTGDAALDILNACDDESNKQTTEGSPRPRELFTKKLSYIATNIPKRPSQISLRKVKKSRMSDKARNHEGTRSSSNL